MRVSEDRYTRDRLRLDLALRLIRHEARTCTIRLWTGLSDDRIRKLYRSYVEERGPSAVRRHRGKSPRQAAYFFRNPETCFQAAQLASLFLLHGLIVAGSGGIESRYRIGAVDSGLLLCRAYEAFVDLHAPARISFEHAWFLLAALAGRAELDLARCTDCGGVRLRDLLARRDPLCAHCGPRPPTAAARVAAGERGLGPLLESARWHDAIRSRAPS